MEAASAAAKGVEWEWTNARAANAAAGTAAAAQGLRCEGQLGELEVNRAGDVALFVSKRLQRPVAALLCLMAIQLVSTLASCEAEPAAMAARVAVGH